MQKKIKRIFYKPTDDELMTVWSLCWVGLGALRWYLAA